MTTIPELESQIREFINNPRKQYLLLQNRAEWNKLCSSLDVIGDTELAIDFYLETLKEPTPDEDGQKYLILYGILQILFVQQDAVKNMAEALSMDYMEDPLLTHIRELRNDSVGHPTKRGAGKGKSFNFIVRNSMNRSGFTLITNLPDRESIFTSVNVPNLICTQREILHKSFSQVLEILRKEEIEHRNMHRTEKLVDAFPQILTYYYEKISEAIRDEKPPEFGFIHVELIANTIEKFKSMLQSRGIFDAYDSISYEMGLIEYPINELKKYFKYIQESKLNSKDVYIFLSFIRTKIDLLKKMAIEIDEEYAIDP